MTIANIVIPREDELLYSWIHRMSQANNSDMEPFVRMYATWPGQPQYGPWTYLISMLAEAIGLSPAETIDHTTLYPLIAPFLPAGSQTKYLSGYIYDSGRSNIFDRKSLKTGKMRFCPECRNEQMNMEGTWTIRRSWQAPGRTRCEKHDTALLEFDASALHWTDNPKGDPMEPILIPEAESAYAAFIKDLIGRHLDGNITDIRNFLVSDLSLKKPENPKGALWEVMERISSGIFAPFRMDISRVSGFIFQNAYMPYSSLIPFLCAYLNGDAGFINIPATPGSFAEDIQRIAASGYTVAGPQRKNLLSLTCERCGIRFAQTASAMLNGFPCPKCARKITDKEILQKIIESTDEATYTMDAFDGKNITATHKKCGVPRTYRTGAFIYGESRCPCSTYYTKERLKKLTDDAGFDLISYKNERLTVRCRKCGNEMAADIGRFLENPRCSVCQAKAKSMNNTPAFEMRETFCRHLNSINGIFRTKEGVPGLTADEVARMVRVYKANGFLEKSSYGIYQVLKPLTLEWDHRCDEERRALMESILENYQIGDVLTVRGNTLGELPRRRAIKNLEWFMKKGYIDKKGFGKYEILKEFYEYADKHTRKEGKKNGEKNLNSQLHESKSKS